MDLVHSSGVLVVQHLQSNYREYHGFLNFVSAVGDPWNIFSLYFPFWFHLSHTVGTKMIWVAVIGDWLNLIFKWLLSGHRPYWWVQETDFYHNASQPHLEQFHITCETGPGSPSGHAMGSSCVWFCLWAAFWIIQMGVCISRVFIATHFPHQVILGLFAGVLVAEAFNRFPPVDNASLKIYLQTGLLLLSSAVGLYLLLASLGADPLWSLAKARRWCANPAWLRLDTTPFAGLVRNLGALFGLGLALNSQLFIQSCRGKNGAEIRFKLTCVTATLTSLQLCNLVRTPVHTELLFYVLAFCKSASVPLCVVAVIPYCIHLLIGDEERKLV